MAGVRPFRPAPAAGLSAMNAPGPVLAPASAGSRSRFPSLHGLHPQDRDGLARLRHALRTPLNQIIGYSEMLLESATEADLTGLQVDLQLIHQAGGRLLVLIHEALAGWKIASASVDLSALERELDPPVAQIVEGIERCLAHCQQQPALGTDLGQIRQSARHLRELVRRPDLEPAAIPGAAGREPIATATLGLPAALGLSGPAGGAPEPAPSPGPGRLLVVDDDPMTREILRRRLERLGFAIDQAADGREALAWLREHPCDLVLLDIVMPVLDGFQTLQALQADTALRHLPVIMLTALDDVETTVRCIEGGATDYVPKPFNAVVLRARINTALGKKRLHDREQAHLEQINRERAKSERLLLNVLPRAVAERLKQGERTLVDSFPDATVVFADIVGFARFSGAHPPALTVRLLNDIFSAFDRIAERHLLEKIKTIGDAYMLVGGVPVPRPGHAAACAEAALDMLTALREFNHRHALDWALRIGMNTGPVVAGIIGTHKFAYDLWGDTVNVASRLESQGQPGRIQLSAATRQALGAAHACERVGVVPLKHVGEIETYFLLPRA